MFFLKARRINQMRGHVSTNLGRKKKKKPGNILIDATWRAMVADLGSSTFKRTATMTLQGTPTFMAPEVIRDGRYTERADIYSFGCLLVGLFGDEPFSQKQFTGMGGGQLLFAVANRSIAPVLPTPDDGVPPLLCALVSECIEYDPALRPTFREILSRLLRIQRGLPQWKQQSQEREQASGASSSSSSSSSSAIEIRSKSTSSKHAAKRSSLQRAVASSGGK
jgi:serine/threonine protein kinase